jgi:hypothetical protein
MANGADYCTAGTVKGGLPPSGPARVILQFAARGVLHFMKPSRAFSPSACQIEGSAQPQQFTDAHSTLRL